VGSLRGPLHPSLLSFCFFTQWIPLFLKSSKSSLFYFSFFCRSRTGFFWNEPQNPIFPPRPRRFLPTLFPGAHPSPLSWVASCHAYFLRFFFRCRRGHGDTLHCSRAVAVGIIPSHCKDVPGRKGSVAAVFLALFLKSRAIPQVPFPSSFTTFPR